MSSLLVGQKVFFVENNMRVREAKIQKVSGGLYLIVFTDGGGIQVKAHRLYATKEEAEQSLPEQYRPKKHGFKSPYDYEIK